MSAINELLDVMRRLRDPQTGCAWDVKQTFATISPYTIEEAYEVADAIDRNDLADLRDELGDLLLQVVFHAQMADEMGEFSFDDVAKSIVDKMVRRHPHVFGDASFADTAALKKHWEAAKAEERAKKAGQVGADDAAGTAQAVVASELDGIAHNLPALIRAEKIQKRAARVGFDWPDEQPVWDKLQEEVEEFKSAVSAKNQTEIEDELGDVLFTVVNIARHHKVDTELALRNANRKFETRFREVERLADAKNLNMQEASLEQLDALWDEAKVTTN